MIKICLVGDMMIGRSFNETFKYNPNFNIWGNTLNVLQNCDLVLGNLETTITNSENKWPNKEFNYKLNSKYKRILNLGNIKHTGCGVDIYEASKYVIHNIKGTKIGIVSYSDHYYYWAANKNKGRINYVDINDDYTDVLDYMKQIKKNVDILIFSIHHGANYVDQIPQNTINFFRDLVSSGIDIVHGHSAHHVLPYEKINDKYIFFSFGGYIDDYRVSEEYRNDLSFITQLTIKKNKIISLNILPTKI